MPDEPEARLAYLGRAAQHGTGLEPLLHVGASVEPVQAYVASHSDLVGERGADRLAIRFGEHVRWDVVVGEDDHIQGYSASGYGPLMEALGIDFSGRPYSAGNG